MRTRIGLNFDWKYSEKYSDDMMKKSFNDSEFASVDIPHANKELPLNYFDEKVYQFVSCYRKHFRLPKEGYEPNKRVLLHFEGAANYAVVNVNGKKAGEHKGAYTPFVFDITDLICKDENVISVMLDSTERKEIPPFGYMVDYLVYGGIYREVWVEIVDEVRINDVFVRTPNVINPKKQMKIDVEFSSTVHGEISLELKDKDDRVIASKKTKASGRIMRFNWCVGGVKCWDIDDPNLYYLTVKYADDEKTVRFGFRTCEFRKDGFFLNDRPVKIMGLNRHQSYPYVGYAMPASAQKADAELLKYKLGCNLARTSHYPNSIHFLDRCDEIGLLVFTEMPSWQYLGDDEWRRNCAENVRQMVLRDRNHPCVILWGVRVNEGQDCDQFYLQTNALARQLDDSRQTGGVRNFPHSSFLEDVYTYNDFSHSGGFIKLAPPWFVAGNKPYLVTENNGHMFPTKSYDDEAHIQEHALRHARVQNASFGNKRISGCIDWCMADYNTHKDFGSGDMICYHGVTDMFRVPKLAASVFASQQDKTPVLENSSNMGIGDHPGGIVGGTFVFTNCDYVKLYKNDKYTSTIYPEDGQFKNLPHSPIQPVDFIGDSLETEDGLDHVTAEHLKVALTRVIQYGFKMPPQDLVKFATNLVFAFLHGKMSFGQISDLVTKYIGNWGSEAITYKFEGYKDGILVKTITRNAVKETHIQVRADSDSLVEDDTYDVTRIELVAMDQNDNRLPYCDETVKIRTNSLVEVIGPTSFSLQGGARAFWVRTKGKSGKAKITVESNNMGKYVVELDVTKK